jgi:hypothetical protein
MFSIFKKKAVSTKIKDVVFAKKEGKWKALLEVAKKTSDTIFVAWFEKSIEELHAFFHEQGLEANVILFRQVHSGMIGSKQVIFIEHYPLQEKEQQVFSSLANNNISVYSSLDEAFFKLFGGENISAVIDKLGLQENEAVSHSMITKSIANAQQKLAAKVTVDQSACSMEEWIQKNAGK